MKLFQLSYLIHLPSSLSLLELRQQIRPVRHPGSVSAVFVVPRLVFPFPVLSAHKADSGGRRATSSEGRDGGGRAADGPFRTQREQSAFGGPRAAR